KGLDVLLHFPGARRHESPVAVGLNRDRGGGAFDRATDQVEVALVLELDLGHAFAAHARAADVLLGRACLTPQAEQHGLQERRLAGPVGAEDPHQPGWYLEFELVFVDPEVAEIQTVDQHEPGPSAPTMARSRYSWPIERTRS